jgi:gas vesicle protein
MKRLLKFLFGAAVGAAAAVLVTPKTGAEWREQLLGDRVRGLLTSGSDESLQASAPEWEAESPVMVAEPLETPSAEGEDLRTRIEETKRAIESEIAHPFQTAPQVIDVPASAFAAEEPQVAEAEPLAEAEPEVEVEPVAEAEPVVEEPLAEAEPVVEEPLAEAEPVIEQPVIEAEPVVDIAPELLEAPEPHADEPLPDVVTPSFYQANREQPVVEAEPVAEEKGEEPIAEAEPAVEEPTIEAPVADESAPISPRIGEREAWLAEVGAEAEEPVAEEPVAEAEPEVEEPVAEAEPEVEEPVAEEPAAEAEPVAEAPVVEDEPDDAAAIDQAEMRRRIEETRARLKAKAFDAMMSGEAALLSRDSGEKPVPREVEVKVDDELEDKLDESLSQEEY